jgi:hypothetical protein
MSTGGQPAPAPAPSPAPTPAPATAANGELPWAGVSDGPWKIGEKPWYEVVVDGPDGEALKAKNFAHPGVLAKSYLELDRQRSSFDPTKSVRIPDENAKPEDWQAFHKKLGRPDSVEGYQEVKWGENADPALVEFGKKIAYELGLSPKLAETVLASKWNEFVAAQNTQGAETDRVANEQVIADLKTNWKGDFDANLAAGNRVVKALEKAGFANEDIAKLEQHVGVATVVKLMATIGKMTGEAGFMEQTPGGSFRDPSQLSPEQAKGEIERLTSDKDFQTRYLTKTDAGHEQALKHMEALYAKAGTLITT